MATSQSTGSPPYFFWEFGLQAIVHAAPWRVDDGPKAQESLEEQWLEGVNLSVFLDCARKSESTLLQAHRAGPRRGFAENALSTIEASLSDGAVFIEIDVAELGDGTLILMHDLTVDRTTNGHGALSTYTLDAFKMLRLVDDEGTVLDEAPPTLNEALELLKGRGIAQLDMKNISVDEIATAVVAQDAVSRSLVITYSLTDALRMHELVPGIMISVAVNSLDDINILRANNFDLSRLQAWIGIGNGMPELDAALADLGIETSFGNFPAEAAGTVPTMI